MLSHELAEVRQIGEQVKSVARGEVPTLVKYADAAPYLLETTREIGKLEVGNWDSDNQKSKIENQKSNDWCTLIDYDKNGEKKVLAAALYRFGEISFADALAYVDSLKKDEQIKLAEVLLGRLGEHDIPLRELEYSTYTFDFLMDQGAYAEFKRHRMMTQTPQRLTTRLGYALPRLIVEAGLESSYRGAMQAAAEMYEKLYLFGPSVAQYIVPNGYNRRVLAQFNLREAYHFCQLRGAKNAHFSIRRIAFRTAEELARVHPSLTKFMHLPDETWQDVEKNYFAMT
jgi:thymidylate synthase ThyX